MKLIEVDIENIYKERRYRKGFLQDLVNEFIHSGMKVAEVEWTDHYKLAKSAYCSLHKCIKNMDVPVMVTYTKKTDKVYLVRKEDKEAK